MCIIIEQYLIAQDQYTNVLSVYSHVYIAVCEFRDILLGGLNGSF